MKLSTAKFTAADYEKLPEDVRAQLIHGELVKDASPDLWHQELVSRAYESLRRVLPKARVQFAPLDVFLDEHNVLQPDVLVLPEGVRPARGKRRFPVPLLVVEVLSAATARRDSTVKTGLYLEHGVREVWLVDPDKRTIRVCAAAGSRTARGGGAATSRVVAGFSLVPDELFRE
jgi:Uma2 family endonuclease